MNDGDRLKLRRPVVAWSDGRGLALATTLAEQHRDLLPRRITNAQLAGLNGVVQAAESLEQVTDFAQHQGTRAARAGRLDVQGYWDAVREALGGLESEAAQLLTQAGLSAEEPAGKGKRTARAPAWLTLWLAQEFVQHLVARSLYIGQRIRPSKQR